MADKKKSVKKATKKELMFPVVMYGFSCAGFLDEGEHHTRFFSNDDANGYLEENERTLVAVYEFVGTEYRTKKVTVDVEDVV